MAEFLKPWLSIFVVESSILPLPVFLFIASKFGAYLLAKFNINCLKFFQLHDIYVLYQMHPQSTQLTSG